MAHGVAFWPYSVFCLHFLFGVKCFLFTERGSYDLSNKLFLHFYSFWLLVWGYFWYFMTLRNCSIAFQFWEVICMGTYDVPFQSLKTREPMMPLPKSRHIGLYTNDLSIFGMWANLLIRIVSMITSWIKLLLET